jgi:hypothetical protein
MENNTNLLSALKSIDVASLSRADWIAVGMALKEEGFPAPSGMTGARTTPATTRRDANRNGPAFTEPTNRSRAAPSFRWQRIAAGLPSSVKMADELG